jgi:hypothetical protein
MSRDVFARPFPEACLSAWQISQLTLEAPGVSAEAQAHCRICDACAARVRDERADMAEAEYERIPARVRAQLASRRRRPLRWLRWLWGGIPAAALTAVAGLALRHSSPAIHAPEIHLKGVPSDLSVTVQRGGRLVLREVPAAEVARLAAGDHLRLRVRPGAATRVEVDGLEGGAWVSYYAGPLPADGWLPMGVAVTSAGETKLRVTLCGTGDRCDAPRMLAY